MDWLFGPGCQPTPAGNNPCIMPFTQAQQDPCTKWVCVNDSSDPSNGCIEDGGSSGGCQGACNGPADFGGCEYTWDPASADRKKQTGPKQSTQDSCSPYPGELTSCTSMSGCDSAKDWAKKDAVLAGTFSKVFKLPELGEVFAISATLEGAYAWAGGCLSK